MTRWLARIFMKEGRIRPLLRVFLCLGIISLCVAAFTTVLTPVTAGLFDWRRLSEATLLNLSYVAQGLGTIGGIVIARRLLDRRTTAELGLAWKANSLRDLVLGFALGAALQLLIFAAAVACGWVSVEGPGPGALHLWTMAGSFLLLTLVAVNEELLARGYILQNLSEAFGVPAAVILSSMFFGASHLLNTHVTWTALLNIAVTGVFLAAGYLATHSLYLPIGIHLAWNFFEGPVLGFAVSGYTGLPSMLAIRVQGPELWTGGAFGPEAGLLGLFAVILGILVVWLSVARKRRRSTSSAP